MLEPGTLNILCGGPSSGKTTLTLQAVRAHEQGESFVVPELTFPPGKVCVVSTDRAEHIFMRLVRALGIHDLQVISTVLDKTFNPIAHSPTLMRDAVSRRLRPGTRTLILDLYNDFIHGQMANVKLLASDGRMNVQWANDMDIAILGLWYPFKQRQNMGAKRVQDRNAGALSLQASVSWKIGIVDAEEQGEDFWTVDVVPPPMGGPKHKYNLYRASDPQGVGPFALWSEEPSEEPNH